MATKVIRYDVEQYHVLQTTRLKSEYVFRKSRGWVLPKIVTHAKVCVKNDDTYDESESDQYGPRRLACPG